MSTERAAPEKLRLEVGLRYRARDGAVVRIVSEARHGRHRFTGNDGKRYAENGRYDVSCVTDADLVAEA